MKFRAIIFFIMASLPVLSRAQPSVAIGDFENASERFHLDTWTRLIPDLLAAELSRTQGIAVVDRGRLGALLDERKLQAAGLTDSSEAKEIGRLLSAEYIVTGAVHDEGEGVRITARVTSVSTGRMVAESVTARSSSHPERMAALLANNLAVRMTGKGGYSERVTLRRQPTLYFLGATVVSAAAASIVNHAYLHKRDAYHSAVSLDRFDPAYNSANRLYHARTAVVAVTGVALASTLICWIRDLSPDRILANPQPVLGFDKGEIVVGLCFHW
jgi:TolB-like protein